MWHEKIPLLILIAILALTFLASAISRRGDLKDVYLWKGAKWLQGLENDKPYTAEYMAHISFWLSMAGSLRGIGVWEYQGVKPLPPEKR